MIRGNHHRDCPLLQFSLLPCRQLLDWSFDRVDSFQKIYDYFCQLLWKVILALITVCTPWERRSSWPPRWLPISGRIISVGYSSSINDVSPGSYLTCWTWIFSWSDLSEAPGNEPLSLLGFIRSVVLQPAGQKEGPSSWSQLTSSFNDEHSSFHSPISICFRGHLFAAIQQIQISLLMFHKSLILTSPNTRVCWNEAHHNVDSCLSCSRLVPVPLIIYV